MIRATINACAFATLLAHCALAFAHHDTVQSIDYAAAKDTPYGRAFDPSKASRTVEISMNDAMRFVPSVVTVKRGESIRFVAKNEGQVMHEMVLGTRAELAEHAEHMKMHPDMEHHDANMLHVAPGATGELGWQFTHAGQFWFGCLVPGHFEAGMVGQVIVTAP